MVATHLEYLPTLLVSCDITVVSPAETSGSLEGKLRPSVTGPLWLRILLFASLTAAKYLSFAGDSEALRPPRTMGVKKSASLLPFSTSSVSYKLHFDPSTVFSEGSCRDISRREAEGLMSDPSLLRLFVPRVSESPMDLAGTGDN